MVGDFSVLLGLVGSCGFSSCENTHASSRCAGIHAGADVRWQLGLAASRMCGSRKYGCSCCMDNCTGWQSAGMLALLSYGVQIWGADALWQVFQRKEDRDGRYGWFAAP